ncbi:flagellar export chaperone FlgN [Thalassotalea sp. G2M2-11]|uniref:flagellar export chaperone FlgN n=1 Tax=Thalassotalea sp. G2M2-11 TaxID=2787627 RepID=UPI0019D07F31
MSTDSGHLPQLQKQLEQLQQLESIIDSEKAILQQQDPAKLTEISELKNQLLIDIQSLDQQFEQSVQFKQDKAQGVYADILAEIEKVLLSCKEKNLVNGQIIQHSELAVERMKTTLLQNHNKSSMTYDSKGKTSGGLSSLGIKA